MGYRLHYATKYDVEYDGGFFNWCYEESCRLLRDLGVLATNESEEIFEIGKEEYKAKIDAVRAEYLSNSDQAHPLIPGYTYGEVLNILDEIYNNSTADYIHLEWF